MNGMKRLSKVKAVVSLYEHTTKSLQSYRLLIDDETIAIKQC